MSVDKYTIKNQNALHFLTFTVIDWMDIFTNKDYKLVLTESLNYCIREKGLIVYAYVIMSSHIHLIVKAEENFNLSDVIRDFKKFTSKRIASLLQEEPENRSKWILDRMKFAGKNLKRVKDFKLWQDGYSAIELDTNELIDQKIEYIHYNPVKAMIVENPEHYIFSSASDFMGFKGYVDIDTEL